MGQWLTTFTRRGPPVTPTQERNCELESQLRSKDQEISRLQRQLSSKDQEISRLQGQLRSKDQDISRLQAQLRPNYQGTSQLRGQLTEVGQSSARAPSGDWVINRNEIQIYTEHELGRGAWGIVYRGNFHGCDVAIKEMYENIMSHETRRVFDREISMASKCRHPCLLQFIGATTDERPLFVSEIMECSLRERLYPKQYNRDDDFSPGEVPVISLDVARALNYLHQKPKPILHHDVSSANVLLWRQDNQWRAKVSDYGTANFVRQNTTNYAGAVIYCAPESITVDKDRPISLKADVYSFGVLLCEMCIKQEPDPETRQLQITQMKNSTFRNLVRQCTRTLPWRRPNMASVIEELQKPPSCSSRPRRTAWGDSVTAEPVEPQKPANVDPIASDL